MPLRLCAIACLTVMGALGATAGEVFAGSERDASGVSEGPWLRLASSAGCAATEAWLAEQIERRIAGRPGLEHEVVITLRDLPHATALHVSIEHSEGEASSKRIVAPTCAEALEASIVIVALALSSELPGAAEQSPEVSHAATEPAPSSGAASAASIADVGILLRHGAASSHSVKSERTWSAHLAAGADVGTLPLATPIVAAGLSAELGHGALRTLLAYGARSTEEETHASLERTSTDFALVEAAYCGALDAGRWLSACGGFDARVVRMAQLTELADGARSEHQRWETTLGALAGVVVAVRASSWRPELDVSAEVPLVGRHAAGGAVSFRALIGAQIDF